MTNKESSTQRVFLGLDQPPLQSAARWLLETQREAGEFNFSDLLIILPGSRAMNRLLQLLVLQSGRVSQPFVPPSLTTIGQLPEYLYEAKKPFASELAMQAAWCRALQQTPSLEIERLFGSDVAVETKDWHPLAGLLSSLHQRLGNEAWSFENVVQEVQRGELGNEIKRWQSLQAIQKRYYSLLDDVGLWDRQAARNVAIQQGECRTDKHVIMLATADLNLGLRAMLAQLEKSPTVLIAAPEEWADRFDSFGSLKTKPWLEAKTEISDARIRIVDQPEDQAFAVGHYLSQLSGQFAADQITIGVPDEGVIPQIERTFTTLDIPCRNLRGQSLVKAAPVRMMLAVQGYLEIKSYDSFASLVRHPDMFQWLSERVGSSTWLSDLDRFQNDNLPDDILLDGKLPFGDPKRIGKGFVEGDAKSLERAERRAKSVQTLNQVHAHLVELVGPLSGSARVLAEWAKPWGNLLLEIYGLRAMDKEDPEDRRTVRACQAIYEVFSDEQQVPEAWQDDMSATDALELAIRSSADGRVASVADPLAVELVGWLDLPLDDAPVVVVTGMNDEFVPASENGHLFLPNSLCEKLGILDNNRRYARDAYALAVTDSVREHCLWVTGRRDIDGEPQKPSRLLFGSDSQTVARRAQAFFSYTGKADARYWLADPSQAPQEQQFVIPHPAEGHSLSDLTVTAFREYLKCPYRFYLSKVMRLEAVDDGLRELDARAFGNLAHDVLEEFGNSEVKDSRNAKEISEFLSSALDRWQRFRYRGSRLPAVRIQIEQLRYRFDRFAELQAERAREGWRIVAVEQYHEHPLMVDGLPFTIRGTIDRVDVNDQLGGRVAIWDYKTSDAGSSPRKTHYSKQKGWLDLQLPLYRYLASQINVLADYDLSVPDLGYIKLPKSIKEIQFEEANWNDQELSEADQHAFRIIRSLRKGIFWPPSQVPPIYSEEWAGICQDRVFEKWLSPKTIGGDS